MEHRIENSDQYNPESFFQKAWSGKEFNNKVWVEEMKKMHMQK